MRRDCLPVAGMAGLLAGALSGFEKIYRDIYSQVREVNELYPEGYAARLALINT